MTIKFSDSQLRRLRANYTLLLNEDPEKSFANLKPVAALVAPRASPSFRSHNFEMCVRPKLMWIAYAAKQNSNEFMGVFQSGDEIITLGWYELDAKKFNAFARSNSEILDLADNSISLGDAYKAIGFVEPGYVDGVEELIIRQTDDSPDGRKEFMFWSAHIGKGLCKPKLIVE